MDRLSARPAAPVVWVTRAEPGASATAARLRARGYAPLVAPLIETRPLPFDAPAAGEVDALAFTSAAGVAAWAAAGPAGFGAKPVFAVGDATAEAAREAGFSRVVSAAGDAAALARLILDGTPAGARVLHVGAAEPAADLAGALQAQGRRARLLAVYETRPVERLPAEVEAALEGASLAAVLVHSPAAARALGRLVAAGQVRRLTLCAFSPACAAPLAALPFAGRAIAAAPNEPALLEALDALRLHAADPQPAGALGKRPPPR